MTRDARICGLTLHQRWERYVRRTDDCWLWVGSVDLRGYGVLHWRPTNRTTKMARAHRLAWEFFRGPIPKGLFVCHTCDVTTWVRPEHLFLGTAGDNSRDMAKKGRWRNQTTGPMLRAKQS